MKRSILVLMGLALAGCAGIEPGNPNSPAALRMRSVIAQAAASAPAEGYWPEPSQSARAAAEALERLETHARNEAIWDGDWPYYP